MLKHADYNKPIKARFAEEKKTIKKTGCLVSVIVFLSATVILLSIFCSILFATLYYQSQEKEGQTGIDIHYRTKSLSPK